MTRDYSQFLPTGAQTPEPAKRAMLDILGWQPFFAQQLDLETLTQTPPVRVVEVHRNGLQVRGADLEALVPPGPEATVGDWLLYDAELPTRSVVLERKSLFKRRAAGHDRSIQMIAANVDTAFVVTSCNNDFNVARLERFLALAFEAEVAPVIVLTKADLCEDPTPFVAEAQKISARVPVVLLNAKSEEPAQKLADWCAPGQTIAFLGTSGVGKSTLVNALFGSEQAETGAIREDDSRGRHTTTSRQLHFTDSGLAILDTPGMRELQLAEAGDGVADLFADVVEIATQCKFRDCAHESEPGCAVRAAIAEGTLEAERFERWRKLEAEERHNTASLAEKRAYDKNFGKMVKSVTKAHKGRKGRR
ncbi:ribosome small subunit-dependent GTPase A [Shimia sp. R11_0]|uniref:ribosome small subunit-dependent GTPase A n=1 Tax=Shimia sp. R11_0 TaxID=2821096 RepID=UPI001ADA4A10|nr:ribosome small subunit-dependent GTPase A [Shimia sp. R11_0]MBO9478796.1 ribosome small subunit-dependent GTPase A [Shimia sp. R11_0]